MTSSETDDDGHVLESKLYVNNTKKKTETQKGTVVASMLSWHTSI